MAFVLITLGLILVISGVRGTEKVFYGLVYDDVLGSGGFIWWFVAIGLVGIVGYSKKLQPVSIAFMSLILLALVLSTKGAIADLLAQIGQTQQAAKSAENNSTTNAPSPLSNTITEIQTLTQRLQNG